MLPGWRDTRSAYSATTTESLNTRNPRKPHAKRKRQLNDTEHSEKHWVILEGGQKIPISGKFILVRSNGEGEAVDHIYTNLTWGEQMSIGKHHISGHAITGSCDA